MQGFNMGRYIPPAALDANPTTTFNRASGKGHALGSRARPDGSLVVRFEMPFAIWCDHCPKPTIIGQGVRFNAAKRKVGNYYSTPIHSFRFTHTACGGEIEVRTDPKNTAYVVVSGGRKRDTGEDKDDSLVKSGEALLATPKETQEQRESAFSHLEKTIEDRAALAAGARRIDELENAAARDWDNPYERNAALRRAFRVGRKERERQAGVDEGIKERMGLGVKLLPESEEDARRAQLVDFGTGLEEKEEKVLARPLFETESPAASRPTTDSKPSRGLKSERLANKRKTALVSEIVGNTRIIRDPFLERKERGGPSATVLPGLKRKRDAGEKDQSSGSSARKMAAVLVDYESE
ncbi:Protein saf4 [Gnomoniopsis smithogilvyi]|uniref:Protein saf4 n=1 Tax=Gnomoniopsis smithogilvyi TaxID=1191159 RepID=A0A9W9CYQ7_9PEZI|nr:Protein saf4 [Gnomoniopsis smithogilvyi]